MAVCVVCFRANCDVSTISLEGVCPECASELVSEGLDPRSPPWGYYVDYQELSEVKMNLIRTLFPGKRHGPHSDARGHQLIRDASRIADETIHRKFLGAYITESSFIAGGPKGRSFPLIDAIDRVLEIRPDDADVLFAKAEAYSFTRDDETGQRLRRQALALAPEHFDAQMREKHFTRWENMFTYPGWNEGQRKIPRVMLDVQAQGNPVQIVRDGLALTLAILVPLIWSMAPRRVHDASWKPVWAETPYGPIFVHYPMFKHSGHQIMRKEFAIPPSPVKEVLQREGSWLIRRFCEVGSIFLVVNDGADAVFNARYTLPQSVRSTLSSIRSELSQMTLRADQAEQSQKAFQWYMENSDLDAIPF